MAKNGKHVKEEVFEILYFENYTYLCQSIFRFVRDEEITKDIVQDVFLKYWQRIHELQINKSPKSYLKRACINQALNYLKEKERRENRESNYFKEVNQLKNTAERPDMKIITNETSDNINKAIDQLPPVCRTTFLLSRHEQKSYKEIARLLNISVNTVEKHIGKALRVLREIFRDF